MIAANIATPVIAANDITSTVKTPATCTQKGITTYTAKVIFNGQEYTSTKDIADILPLGHKAEKVEAKAPTSTETGNIEYWYCAECDTYFKDEALKVIISKEQTVIAPTGEANPKPSKPEEKPGTADIPQTGDDSNFDTMGGPAACRHGWHYWNCPLLQKEKIQQINKHKALYFIRALFLGSPILRNRES